MSRSVALVVIISIVLGILGGRSLAQTKTKGTSTDEILFSALTDDGGNWDIIAINADGTGDRRLTMQAADDRQPVWSPDRQTILFTSNRDGNTFGIYTMNSDGSNQHEIVSGDFYHEYARWSPDRQRIVYVSTLFGTKDIFIADADGRNEQRITHAPGDETEPVWSPNGEKIAYSASIDVAYGLYVYDLESGDVQSLYVPPERDVYSPAWSADGQQIAVSIVVYDAIGTYSEISVIHIADGELEVISTINGVTASSTSWSPDDKSISYSLFDTSIDGGSRIIQIVDVNGENLRQLQTTASSSADPNWSLPEGEFVSTVWSNVGSSTRLAQTVECPGVMPSRLVIGDTARVTLGESANRLRNGPGTNFSMLGTIPPGGVFEVLDGPECNQYAWYQVNYRGTVGWTGEGDNRDYWIEIYDSAAAQGSSINIRTSAGDSDVLLTGGRGLTNGATLGPGEFQAEYYCNRQGYGTRNDSSNWYCTSSSRAVSTLSQSDFDRICRDTYNNPQAYAALTGSSRTPAYNWRCYGPP